MRQRSADDYGAIRQRQEDLFGRAPVGEAHVNVPFVRKRVPYDDLRNEQGQSPCFCGTMLEPKRVCCIASKEALASQYYCTGRLPKENAP